MMISFTHTELYPWFNKAYEDCDSCKYRDHDESPNYANLKERCMRCTPRPSDEEKQFYPTEHTKRHIPSRSWYEGSLEQAADRARMRASRPVSRGTRHG